MRRGRDPATSVRIPATRPGSGHAADHRALARPGRVGPRPCPATRGLPPPDLALLGIGMSQTVTAEHGPPLPQTVVLAKQQLDYFGQDDPSRLRHWLGTAYYDFAYEFDRRHQLASVDEDGERMVAAYTFTTAGKLASAIVAGTPAPGGELVPRKVAYEYASPADPEAVSALRDDQGGALRSYTYDTVGSMVTRSSGGGTPEEFVYDGEDQLRRATRTGSGAGVEEYFYDHAGQRAAVVTRDAGGAVESVRVFFGDAEVVLSPTGWVTKAHAHLSLGTPVARITDRSELELQYHARRGTRAQYVPCPSGDAGASDRR